MKAFLWFLRIGFPVIGLIFLVTGATLYYINSAQPVLQVDLLSKTEILGAAYKIYGDESMQFWLLRVVLRNDGKGPMKNVRITFFIPNYTSPQTKRIPLVLPGQTVVEFYYPLFNESIIKETSGRTIPINVAIEYQTNNGKKKSYEYEKSVKLLGRNYLTWTSLPDDEITNWFDQFSNWPLLGVYMTPNDELVKNISGKCAGGLNTSSSDEDRIKAWARIFYCLREIGVRYIQEPSDQWTPHFNQYVRFPRETLEQQSGTCLDLALLFASMAQAVGIDAGVALMPGHAIPYIRLSDGTPVFVEATFVDRSYAYSHFAGVVSKRVDFKECYQVATQQIQKVAQKGTLILANYNDLRKAGFVSPW